MDTQHTPGPLAVNTYRCGDYSGYQVYGERRVVATLPVDSNDVTSGEARANAYLYAAAPDLLAALKATREEIRSLMARAERRSLADWARTLLNDQLFAIGAAIAKAEANG